MSVEPRFERGDRVVTMTGEFGVVVGMEGERARVCFSQGCSAALVDAYRLRLARPDEVPDDVGAYGYHRLDPNGCPDYDGCPLPYSDCRGPGVMTSGHDGIARTFGLDDLDLPRPVLCPRCGAEMGGSVVQGPGRDVVDVKCPSCGYEEVVDASRYEYAIGHLYLRPGAGMDDEERRHVAVAYMHEVGRREREDA